MSGVGPATHTSELSLQRPLLRQRETLTERLPLPQVYQIDSEPFHTPTIHACSALSLPTDPEARGAVSRMSQMGQERTGRRARTASGVRGESGFLIARC